MLPCRILRLSASIKVRGTQTHVRQLSDCGEGDFESSNKKAVRELELQRAEPVNKRIPNSTNLRGESISCSSKVFWRRGC